MDLTIVVSYTGEPWRTLARTRAIPSAKRLGVPVVVGEGATVAQARNNGLAQVQTEWVVHLDADDELEPGYADAMSAGTADLRAPSVRYVHGSVAQRPGMPRVAGHQHDCTADCLPQGNWLVIGTAARTGMLRAVGWREWPVYEDWAMWLQCWRDGATVEAIPDAVYRAHVNPRSRNRGTPMPVRNRTHHEIVADVLGVSA